MRAPSWKKTYCSMGIRMPIQGAIYTCCWRTIAGTIHMINSWWQSCCMAAHLIWLKSSLRDACLPVHCQPGSVAVKHEGFWTLRPQFESGPGYHFINHHHYGKSFIVRAARVTSIQPLHIRHANKTPNASIYLTILLLAHHVSSLASSIDATVRNTPASAASTAISKTTNDVTFPNMPARITSTRYVNGLR